MCVVNVLVKHGASYQSCTFVLKEDFLGVLFFVLTHLCVCFFMELKTSASAPLFCIYQSQFKVTLLQLFSISCLLLYSVFIRKLGVCMFLDNLLIGYYCLYKPCAVQQQDNTRNTSALFQDFHCIQQEKNWIQYSWSLHKVNIKLAAVK